MKMKRGQFIHATLTSPKDEKKRPRCIVDVLVENPATEKETYGSLRQLWMNEEESEAVFSLLKECEVGQSLDLDPIVVTRQNRDFIDYRIAGISK